MPPGKRTIFEMMLHQYWHNIELFILDISRYYRSLDQDPIWISTSPPSTDGRKHSNATSVRWLIYLISNFYFYVFKTWNFVYFIEGIPYSVSAALKGVLKRVRQTRSWYWSWFSKPFVNCPMLRIYRIEASLQSRLKSVCYYRIWSFWNCIVLWLHLVWKTVSYHRYLNGLQTACKKTIFNRLFKDSFSNRWSKRLTGCRVAERCWHKFQDFHH